MTLCTGASLESLEVGFGLLIWFDICNIYWNWARNQERPNLYIEFILNNSYIPKYKLEALKATGVYWIRDFSKDSFACYIFRKCAAISSETSDDSLNSSIQSSLLSISSAVYFSNFNRRMRSVSFKILTFLKVASRAEL